MAPLRRNPQSSQDDAPNIAWAIEAMVAAMTQQSTAMMQPDRCSDKQQRWNNSNW